MKKLVKIVMLVCMCIWMSGCGTQKNESAELTEEVMKNQNVESTEEMTKKESAEPTEETMKDESAESTEETMKDESAEPAEETIKAERIVCWGDSLTYGQGGNGVTYPSVLEEKLNLEVINYGIQGETARQIAIRMGVLPMTTGAFEIPADTTPAEITLWQGGEDPIMMRLGDCAINPCKINGVEGTVSYRVEDNKYYFVRSQAGEAVQVEADTLVETYASQDKKSSDIVVLFAGTNLPPDKNTVGELIDMEKKMLEYLGTDKYIVIGLTSKKLIPDIEPINEALSEAFGEHFLDIRKYLLENGLKDAGIEPTKKDKKNIKKGEIPSSIRVDEVHGNEAFYRIIGEQVYNILEEMGYVTEADRK